MSSSSSSSSSIILTTRSLQKTPQSNNELMDYLRYVYSICKFICDSKTNYSEGPIYEYETLHIDNNQRENGIEYGPLLISKSFDTIYTNTGIIRIKSNHKIKGERKKKCIDHLNLVVYNNNYYYVDHKKSYKFLKNYFELDKIKDTWKTLLDTN